MNIIVPMIVSSSENHTFNDYQDSFPGHMRSLCALWSAQLFIRLRWRLLDLALVLFRLGSFYSSWALLVAPFLNAN